MDSRSSQETSREDDEQVQAQYEGEDVRPTSQKELSGWYSYGFAAEVFVICAMGTSLYSHFKPPTIEMSKRAGAHFRSQPALQAGIREYARCSYGVALMCTMDLFLGAHRPLYSSSPGQPTARGLPSHNGSFHTVVCF
jgi:hypothetical protein